ncbi:hypothetical protein B0H34DRAFT_93218 [Crassisporium funariophilum]|nr:hypothetical protein B0H34DRAFT_93218 [Crassisporium funariophilum]
MPPSLACPNFFPSHNLSRRPTHSRRTSHHPPSMPPHFHPSLTQSDGMVWSESGRNRNGGGELSRQFSVLGVVRPWLAETFDFLISLAFLLLALFSNCVIISVKTSHPIQQSSHTPSPTRLTSTASLGRPTHSRCLCHASVHHLSLTSIHPLLPIPP